MKHSCSLSLVASWDSVFSPIGRDRTKLDDIFTLKKWQYGAASRADALT